MPFPFKEKSRQFADYQVYYLEDNTRFKARDNRDAQLYASKCGSLSYSMSKFDIVK